MKREKFVLIALTTLFLMVTFQTILSLGESLAWGRLFDFASFYRPAARAALSGISIYSPEELQIYSPEKLPFVLNYPTTILFLLIPFSLPSEFLGQIIWTIFSFFSLILSFFLAVESLNLKLDQKDFMLLFSLILLAFPTKWTLGMGQTNNFLLLLMVLTFFFYQKGSDWLAGLSLGTAVSLKVVPLFLLVYFLIKRKHKVVLASFLTILILFLAAGWSFGFNLIPTYFLKVVPGLFGAEGKEIYYNQAFSGFIGRLVLNKDIQTLLAAFFAFEILRISFGLLVKRKEVTSLDYSLVISSLLLINGFAWQHHFVWLLFPFLATFSFLRKKKKQVLMIPLLIAYFLVAFNFQWPNLLTKSLSGRLFLSHCFFGNLLVRGILVYLI